MSVFASKSKLLCRLHKPYDTVILLKAMQSIEVVGLMSQLKYIHPFIYTARKRHRAMTVPHCHTMAEDTHVHRAMTVPQCHAMASDHID